MKVVRALGMRRLGRVNHGEVIMGAIGRATQAPANSA